jgi:hypothetical protein
LHLTGDRAGRVDTRAANLGTGFFACVASHARQRLRLRRCW